MLAIRQLGHQYPGAPTPALVDVSLQARRGSVLGLLGPNGAGKTTLISHLSGALALRQGEILVDGEPLEEVRRTDPTRIAVAPQDFAFYPTLTVRQNLDCFAGAARIPAARRAGRLQACLATTRLEHQVDTRADRLSGGLKRRLNLAIALLPEPELIVFDEPTVGVDPQTRAFVLETIRALAAQGAAVIYTSHYMAEIEAVADDVLIIDHGRVLREGTLGELLADDTMSLTITATGLPLPALRELLGRHGVVEDTGAPDNTLLLRLAAGTRPAEVLAALDAAGATLQRAEFGRRNLEQLFMSLTQRPLRD